MLVVEPPVGIELFSQHQQRRCFGERSVFAQQFSLKFLDTFLVFASLLAVICLLGFVRLLTADEGLSPRKDLRHDESLFAPDMTFQENSQRRQLS